MANKIPRVPVREQDPKVRVTNFEEVCYGYDLDEARLEASRCLGCKKPRCVEHCPVSLQIPQFIAQLRDGNLAEAARIIAQDSSLPSVCGRVCPQETQCEGSCILGVKGESVAIGKLERFVGDWSIEHGAEATAPAPSNGRKVAVVGSGPAGMFAALTLARAGARPIVLERGKAVPERQRDVESFWRGGRLQKDSNVQFGEGGAGTFSDGKLMTGIKKDMYTAEVFRELTAAGAPEEILYLAKPHLGTDRLAQIVQNIRAEIVSLGGEYRFQNRLEDLLADDDGLKAVKIRDAGGSVYEEPVSALVLAIGHSARDTFEMLFRRGVPMTSKAFSVGVRIEHPQSLIDRAVYHDFAGHQKLGAADYKLAVHLPNGRSAYTFCMCPGGVVVPAASEEGRVVTNGMSYYARDRENANSALLVGVGPEDFGSDHPLSGMYWQRRLEENAFRAGGSTYAAPAQRVEDLLKGRPSVKGGEVVPSYARGVVWGGFEHVLPAFVTETLRLSIAEMDRKLHGFNFPDAVMTGVETRSSSPIRILRGDSLQSPLTGLYPCGEGAGYAGGIVSAAADGIRVALAVLQKHAE